MERTVQGLFELDCGQTRLEVWCRLGSAPAGRLLYPSVLLSNQLFNMGEVRYSGLGSTFAFAKPFKPFRLGFL